MKGVAVLVLLVFFLSIGSAQGYILGNVQPLQVEIGTQETVTMDIGAPLFEEDKLSFSLPAGWITTLNKKVLGNDLILDLDVGEDAEEGPVDVVIESVFFGETYTFKEAFTLIAPFSVESGSIGEGEPSDGLEPPGAFGEEIDETSHTPTFLPGLLNYDLDIDPLVEDQLSFTLYSDEIKTAHLLVFDNTYPFLKLEDRFTTTVFLDEVDFVGGTFTYSLEIDGNETEEESYTLQGPQLPLDLVLPDEGHTELQSLETEGEEDIVSKIVRFFYLLYLLATFQPTDLQVATSDWVQYKVTMPTHMIYNNNIDDYHLFFNGTVTDCRVVSPPGPAGWMCKINAHNSNSVEFWNENGQAQTSGSVIDGLQVKTDPPGAPLLDHWPTTFDSQGPISSGNHTSSRLAMKENFSVTFDDCNNYCTGKTNAQFQAEAQAHVQAACEKFKAAYKVVTKELNMIQSGSSAETTQLDKAKANANKLKTILEGALAECRGGVVIECDSSYNINCNADTIAFVPTPFGQSTHLVNLHLCPSYCTGSGQESTILHELTHYGDSSDDLSDPVNAHDLESLIPFLNRACMRTSFAYAPLF